MRYNSLHTNDASTNRSGDQQDHDAGRDLEMNLDSYHDIQVTGSETSSLLDGDTLTPGTFSPPSHHAGSSSPVASTFPRTIAPIVCCRAGSRPIAPPPYQSEPDVSSKTAKGLDRQSTYLPLKDEQQDESYFARSTVRSGRRGQSRHWVRGLAAVVILLALFLTHHSLLSQVSRVFPWPGKLGLPCSSPHDSRNVSYVFEQADYFSFLEEVDPNRNNEPSLKGTLRMEPAPAGQTADIVVSVHYEAPGKRSLSYLAYEASSSSIRIQAPKIIPSHPGPRSHGKASATISLKPNINLANLTISTASFAITASPDLFARANVTIASTTLATPHNPIDLPAWTSRQTILHTTSSRIAGTFTLLDLVDLSTSSGSITATVNPGEADPSNPSPAVFKALSHSGSVHAAFPRDATALPRREYSTSVRSDSGSVTGDYLLGAGASLTSYSGSIRAQVLAFTIELKDCLKTTSRSGRTEVTVVDPGVGEGAAGFRGSHESASGSMKLRYPGAWEGKIEGRSGSGRVKVRGPGVVVDVDDGPGMRLWAHKGEGEGSVLLDSHSGSVDLLIG